MAQVFDSRNLLPSSFEEEGALRTPESSPIGQPGKLRLELRRTESAFSRGVEKSMSWLSSS